MKNDVLNVVNESSKGESLANNETNNNTSSSGVKKKREGDAIFKTMDSIRTCVFTNGKNTDVDKFKRLYPLLQTMLQDYKTKYGEDGITRKTEEWITNSKPYFPRIKEQDQDQGGFSVNHDEIVTWHKPVYNVQLAIAEQCMKPYAQGRTDEARQNFKELCPKFMKKVLEYYAHVGDDDNITSFRKWYEKLEEKCHCSLRTRQQSPKTPYKTQKHPSVKRKGCKWDNYPPNIK